MAVSEAKPAMATTTAVVAASVKRRRIVDRRARSGIKSSARSDWLAAGSLSSRPYTTDRPRAVGVNVRRTRS